MVPTASCPHCDKKLRNETPGQTVRCPGCRKPFQLPGLPADEDPLQPKPKPPVSSPVDEWDDTPEQPAENDLMLHHLVECKELLRSVDQTASRAAARLTDVEATGRLLSRQIKTLNTLVFVIAIPFILSLALAALVFLAMVVGVGR